MVLAQKLDETQSSTSSDVDLHYNVFWNFIRRAKILGRFCIIWGSNWPKFPQIGKNVGNVSKKGGKFWLPTIFKKGKFDAEFNVDSDSVIKYDLILGSDWLMGVQSCKGSDDGGRVMVAKSP